MQLHLKVVWEAARAFLQLVICHLADEITAEALLRDVIDPLMEEQSRDMDAKLLELLVPHQKNRRNCKAGTGDGRKAERTAAVQQALNYGS
jgi:hypothetical protein